MLTVPVKSAVKPKDSENEHPSPLFSWKVEEYTRGQSKRSYFGWDHRPASCYPNSSNSMSFGVHVDPDGDSDWGTRKLLREKLGSLIDVDWVKGVGLIDVDFAQVLDG